MKVALLTREFPPEVYGGAGVHVEYLSRELAHLVDVSVYCFGAPRSSPLVAGSYQPWSEIPGLRQGAALRAMSVDLLMSADVEGVDIVHSHTWYANYGGHLAKLLYDIPHVMTAHSLEPLRPWKAEQLGSGYALSSYIERTAIESADAVIAVSEAMGRRHPGCLSGASSPGGSTSFTTGSTPTSIGADDSADVLDRSRDRPGATDGHVRRVGSPGRRASSTCSTPPPTSTRTPRSSCAPARRTRRRSAPRYGKRSPSCAEPEVASSGSRRCCRGATWSSC